MERSRSQYAGLLLLDPRWTASVLRAASTFTEAGPLPGFAVADGDTRMELSTTGPTTLTEDVELFTVRGGMPDTRGATFAWRNTGDVNYRGWDAPYILTGWTWVDYSAAAGAHRQPHGVTLPDGSIVMVGSDGLVGVESWVRSAAGAWSAAVTVDAFDDPMAVMDGTHPTVIRTGGGRLQVFYWVELSGGTHAQVRMSYSDDDGATWTIGQRYCLPSRIDLSTNTPGRLRAAEASGRVLLLAAIRTADWDTVAQYGSADLGCTFSLVDTLTDEAYGFPDVVAADGVFITAIIGNAASSVYHQPVVRILATPFSTLSSADAVTITAADSAEWAGPVSQLTTGNFFDGGELALVLDDDGTLYLYGCDFDDEATGYVVMSRDGGSTWTYAGHGPGTADGATWWRSEDADVRPADFCAVVSEGQVVLAGTLEVVSGSGDGSICAWTLGGYSTVTLPFQVPGYFDPRDQVGWSVTWVGFEEPSTGSQPWAKTTGGGPTINTNSTGLAVQHSGVADTVAYTDTITTTFTDGVIAVLEADVTSGEVFLSASCSDGVHNYSVRVTVSATSIVLRDMIAGSDIDTVTTSAGATGVEVLLAVGNDSGGGAADGKVRAWYRAAGSALDRQWTSIGHSSSLNRGGGATSTVAFGTLTGHAAALAHFQRAAHTEGDYTGGTLYAGQANPRELAGRPFAASPTWVQAGLRIAARTGPTVAEETWTIAARAQYAVDNILPTVEPSPARTWRTVDTSSSATIEWRYYEGVATASRPLGPVMALYLGNINWRTASLYRVSAAGAATKVLDIDTATGMSSLPYTRIGDVVTVSLSAACPYFSEHQLAGACFDFGGGDVRRIITNSEGSWQTSSRKLRLLLDTATLAPSSGNGAIRPRDALVLLPQLGEISVATYRLVIDAQDCAEDYMETGIAWPGTLHPFAYPNSWGRRIETRPLVQLTESRTGARKARSLNARARRSVELSWNDESRQRPVLGTAPAPDYIAAYPGGEAWAAPAATLENLGGLIERLGGVEGLVVYVPFIPAGTSTRVLNHPEEMLYGRVRSESWGKDGVQGDERTNEVWRGGTLRIEAEL